MQSVVELLLDNIGQLCIVPSASGGRPQCGPALGELGLISGGAIAMAEGRIVAAGPADALRAAYRPLRTLDVGGRCVTPGLVDPHTHLPWMGDRAVEFEQRIAGVSYMAIMQAGGGIMSTVRQTRAATVEELVAANLPRLQRMLAHGTTSVECKTGYGLETTTELKQLDAILALAAAQPIELTPTFLPAHATPAEYVGQTEAYIELIIQEMLPAGQRWMQTHGHTLFCDVFCEEGVFDLGQTRRILRAAQTLGYRLKLHADEFVGLGGAALAVELGAVSADHLVCTPPADIQALGQGATVAVALPGTPFGLGEHAYTPAHAILAAGGALALATDCNPGTCWCESMQFIIALACRYLRLTPAQALVAATLNAAHAIGREAEIGSLEPGKQADILVLDADQYQMLGYRFGGNLTHTVLKRGRVVYSLVT